MAAGHRDVVDPKIAFVTASQLKDFLLSARPDDVNNPAVVLFLTEAFKDEVVSHGLLVLYEIVGPTACLEHKRVGIFADFTFKTLPEKCLEIRTGLCLTLNFKPTAETLQMDEANRASALA